MTFYEECKETGKFVTPRAAENWEEFFSENLKVFYTHPDWVKEQHPDTYHEVEKIDVRLKILEYLRD